MSEVGALSGCPIEVTARKPAIMSHDGVIQVEHQRRLLLTAMVVALTGCASSADRLAYRTAPERGRSDSLSAQRLNDAGLTLIEDGEFEKAEGKFRDALAQDLYHAPAHNNLGLVLLHTERHYEAAWEFEYAAKLAPNAVEPRQNLGLLLEEIGRIDRAIEEYESALTLDPNDAVSMRHLARAYVKSGEKQRRLKDLLEKLLLIPNDHQWDAWIRGQLIRVGRVDGDVAPFQDPASK